MIWKYSCNDVITVKKVAGVNNSRETRSIQIFWDIQSNRVGDKASLDRFSNSMVNNSLKHQQWTQRSETHIVRRSRNSFWWDDHLIPCWSYSEILLMTQTRLSLMIVFLRGLRKFNVTEMSRFLKQILLGDCNNKKWKILWCKSIESPWIIKIKPSSKINRLSLKRIIYL